MRYSILIVLIILCVLVTGCVTGSDKPKVDTKLVNVWHSNYIEDTDQGRVIKVYIPEDNVTCYLFDNYYGGGISCLRDVVV